MHPFICALPACFCLPLLLCLSHSPLVFPVYWTETCWYEARLHSHEGTTLWCFWSAARSDMSTAPCAHSSDWSCSIMGSHRQPKMHTHTCSLCRSYKHGHTHANTHTHPVERACGPCVGSAHSGVACLLDTRERERWCVWFPLSCPFLPLTVRWMIAITGAINETEWRSMRQGDTAMGNQPSDYCTLLPWEHCAVYLCGGFVVSYAFSPLFHPSVWPFDVQNMKASSQNMCRLREGDGEGECLRFTT